MRDFNFEGANTSAADIAGPRPVVEEVSQSIIMDETLQEESPFREDLIVEDSSGMRPFHTQLDDDEEASNLPKYLGAAAMVAILAVGGGIYAYESSTATQTPKHVAMKSTAPTNVASNQPVTPPPALPQENRVPATPAPSPAPPMKSGHETPAPEAAAPMRQASAKPTAPGVGIGPTDDAAIDAPMTFTADDAPPPQRVGSSSQLAQAASAPSSQAPADQAAANPTPADQTATMQQPVTAPNVGNNTQPTASVAQLPQRTLQPSIQPAQ